MSSQADEDNYENWKKNIPFMYEIAISQELKYPSLTVQWINEVEQDGNNNEIHRLLLSSYTGNEDQVHLHICKIVLPSNIDQEVDFTLLNNVWNTQDVGKLQIEFSIPAAADINRLRCMPQDFKIIATQLANGEIAIFDLSKKQISTKFSQGNEGYGLSWNNVKAGQLLSGSYDTKIYQWDLEKEQLMATFTQHEKEIEDVCWHPNDPNLFLASSDDKTYSLCDTRIKQGVVNRQKVHESEIFCIQFNPFYPTLFLTGSADSDAKLFDLNKPDQELHSFEYHEKPIYSLQWCPTQHNLFATGSEDNKVVVWDQMKIGNEIQAEDEKDGPSELLFYHGGHRSKVTDISWNTKSPMLIASVEESTSVVQIWKMQKQLLEDDDNDQIIQEAPHY